MEILTNNPCLTIRFYIVSVLGWDKGYTVKYNPLPERVKTSIISTSYCYHILNQGVSDNLKSSLEAKIN